MATPLVQLNIRVTPELHDALTKLATARKTGIGHEVTTAIRAHLAAAGKGKRK